jgi:hypothetical protein
VVTCDWECHAQMARHDSQVARGEGEAIHRMLLVAFLGRQCDVPPDCTNKPLEILFPKSQQNGRF